jgi:hypothetical protein
VGATRGWGPDGPSSLVVHSAKPARSVGSNGERVLEARKRIARHAIPLNRSGLSRLREDFNGRSVERSRRGDEDWVPGGKELTRDHLFIETLGQTGYSVYGAWADAKEQRMGYFDRLLKLFSATTEVSPEAGVSYQYGCPRCAVDAFHDVKQGGLEWSLIESRTHAVKGIPPFFYTCQECNSLWRISDPDDYSRDGSCVWYAQYVNGTAHIFSIDTCPDCDATLSRYKEYDTVDQEQGHSCCMNCRAEKHR